MLELFWSRTAGPLRKWTRRKSPKKPRRIYAKFIKFCLMYASSRSKRLEAKMRYWNILSLSILLSCQSLMSCFLERSQCQRQSNWLNGKNSDRRKEFLRRERDQGWFLILSRTTGFLDSVWDLLKRFKKRIIGFSLRSQSMLRLEWILLISRRMRRRLKRRNRIWENWRIKYLQLDLSKSLDLKIKFLIILQSIIQAPMERVQQLKEVTTSQLPQCWKQEKKLTETK